MDRTRTIDDFDDPDGLYGDKNKDDDYDGGGDQEDGDGSNDDVVDSDFAPEGLEDLVDESADHPVDSEGPVKKAVSSGPSVKRGAARRQTDNKVRLDALLAELRELDQKLAEDGGEVDQRDRGLTLSPMELRRDLPATLHSLCVLKKEREELDKTRPRTRDDCQDGPRPCVRVSCQWHPYLDVNMETGAIKFNFPQLEVHELPTTCILDEIEGAGDGILLERIGVIMNLTRERVRQTEVRGLIKIQAAGRAEEAAAREAAAGNGVSEATNEIQSGGNSPADLGVDFTPLKLD